MSTKLMAKTLFESVAEKLECDILDDVLDKVVWEYQLKDRERERLDQL